MQLVLQPAQACSCDGAAESSARLGCPHSLLHCRTWGLCRACGRTSSQDGQSTYALSGEDALRPCATRAGLPAGLKSLSMRPYPLTLVAGLLPGLKCPAWF